MQGDCIQATMQDVPIISTFGKGSDQGTSAQTSAWSGWCFWFRLAPIIATEQLIERIDSFEPSNKAKCKENWCHFFALAIGKDTRKGQQPETLDEHNQFAWLIHRACRNRAAFGYQRGNARNALTLFRSQLDHLLDLGSTE